MLTKLLHCAILFGWLQVIHQLKQLGTVWQDVLPVSIYCKAMGNLLNTAITEIIAKIMMLEVSHFLSFFKSWSLYVNIGLVFIPVKKTYRHIL